MAWSDAAREAAREARRRKGGSAAIQKRYYRTVRGSNLANKQLQAMHQTLTKLESKTDDWGREKHSGTQIKLQDRMRSVTKRVRAWRKVQDQYRLLQGKALLYPKG